jgi:hypothetical protein
MTGSPTRPEEVLTTSSPLTMTAAISNKRNLIDEERTALSHMKDEKQSINHNILYRI